MSKIASNQLLLPPQCNTSGAVVSWRKQNPARQADIEPCTHGDWISCAPPHRSVKCVFSQISILEALQLVYGSEKAF